MLKLLIPRSLRNWLRAPRKSIFWLGDELRHLIGRDLRTQIRPGWLITCHPGALRCAYFAQVSDPEQIEEFDVFINLLHEGCALLDVGAHFGIFSFAALHFGGSLARVVAVDPSPEALRMIRIQAEANRIAEGRLETIRAAVGAEVGATFMVRAGVGSAGYYVLPKSNHKQQDFTPTPLVSVDHLVETYKFRPTHLKIDVEGAELAALSGSVKTLSTCSPIICLELHGQLMREMGGDPNDVLTFLAGVGYKITHVCGGADVCPETICNRDLVRLFASKICSKGQASPSLHL